MTEQQMTQEQRMAQAMETASAAVASGQWTNETATAWVAQVEDGTMSDEDVRWWAEQAQAS